MRAATAGDAKAPWPSRAPAHYSGTTHFQYNGLLLGLLVYTLFMLRRGDHVKAGALFALLCCAKHLFLTLAPVSRPPPARAPAPTIGGVPRARRRFHSGARFGFGAPLHPSLARGATRKCNDGARGASSLRRARPRAQLLGAERLGLHVFADRILLKVLRRSAGAARRGRWRRPSRCAAPGPKACALLTVLAGLPAVYAAARASSAAARAPDPPLRGARGARGLLLGWCPRPLPCLLFASTARHT